MPIPNKPSSGPKPKPQTKEQLRRARVKKILENAADRIIKDLLKPTQYAKYKNQLVKANIGLLFVALHEVYGFVRNFKLRVINVAPKKGPKDLQIHPKDKIRLQNMRQELVDDLKDVALGMCKTNKDKELIKNLPKHYKDFVDELNKL